jgi:hypothetical protein
MDREQDQSHDPEIRLCRSCLFAAGKLVISALGRVLLVFMTDFVKIALSTDRVRPSRSLACHEPPALAAREPATAPTSRVQ